MKTTKKLNGLTLKKQTIANLEKKKLNDIMAGGSAYTCIKQVTCPLDEEGNYCTIPQG